MIKLLKGDDATHVVEIDLPEAAYADGVQIEFALGDLVVLMPSTPRVSLTFPASWTRLQPCGRQLGSFTLISPTGERATVTKTYPVYITDDVTAVGAAGSVSGSVIPAIDFSGIETLDASSTPGDTKDVLNEILRRLKALCITLAVVFTAPLVTLATAVTWAPLDTIPGNAPVVTNVSLAGLATTNDLATAPFVPLHWTDNGQQVWLTANEWGLTMRSSVFDGMYTEFSPESFNTRGVRLTQDSLAFMDSRLRFSGRFYHYDDVSRAVEFPVPEIEQDTLALQSGLDAVSAVAHDALLAAENNEVAVEALDTKVEGTLSFVYGDDVNLVITNYFGTRDLPRLQIRQRVTDESTNYWRIVWDEVTRWNSFNLNYDAFTNSVLDELSFKADRAFGYYDSHTGGVAPDNFLSVSAKSVLLGGGGSFQKVVTSGGDFFVATSSDPTVYSTTTNGFFKLVDGDGTPLFEYVKGNKRLVWGVADSVTTKAVDGLTHLYITYAVEASERPTLETSLSLDGGGTWIAEDDSSSPVYVVWSGSSGNWQADIYSKTASHPTFFVKASYYEGGESYIKPTVAQGMNKVVIDGITYTVKVTEINGTKVLALE